MACLYGWRQATCVLSAFISLLEVLPSHQRMGIAAREPDPLERLDTEIKRRTNVVGIFPNDAAIAHAQKRCSSRPLLALVAFPLAAAV